MTLSQILEGDFFTEYIKIGNIMMLSRGRNDVDNVFTLKEGQLTMYLDKETYERAGLVGKPYGAKGNRGLRPRWLVEFDLRSPSMFRGKKGFDRLVYACKNVLIEPLTWLFCNVADKSELTPPYWRAQLIQDLRPVIVATILFYVLRTDAPQLQTPTLWTRFSQPGVRRRLRSPRPWTLPCHRCS